MKKKYLLLSAISETYIAASSVNICCEITGRWYLPTAFHFYAVGLMIMFVLNDIGNYSVIIMDGNIFS
jgi:hypothetical protein